MPQVLKFGLKPENEIYFRRKPKNIFTWFFFASSKASKLFVRRVKTVPIWI